MTRILKSDLTYSLTGGFLIGVAALFFLQPADQQRELAQTLSTTVSVASQLFG